MSSKMTISLRLAEVNLGPGKQSLCERDDRHDHEHHSVFRGVDDLCRIYVEH